ncbi:phosphoribosylformylglycinamidine cyclo-ligase [Candidatus Haliotispira prima]|uniref:Phosphoribosylformylglycinamidine cyclo-ligase n=1 Tax=Candidatus Haliotispira prima TaxID=3034016 RepID=A0ABY8MI76_9SPIO|nr:phosphoribosylformylglycinamidine cyclo-ligase [Candidatus Haliotispira prima]
MDYKDSGVDKERGYQLVQKIREQEVKTSGQQNILGGVGGFASLYALKGYRDPVLVSGTDGVGTKLKLAFDFGIYDTVGQDCVAMCVNDILCTGAEPLFFLDYIACDRLDVEIASALVGGISQACESIDIPLLGGETAEMPGFYNNGLYDMAGFCVGVVERDQILSREQSRPGDVIIGLAGSGLHSNGFSLVRKVLAKSEEKYGPIDYDRPLPELSGGESGGIEGSRQSLKQLLLEPTVLYARVLPKLREWGDKVHSIAHITGGGIHENLPRALADGLCAEVQTGQIRTSEIFRFIRNPASYLVPGESAQALISEEEMWHTFNMGLGLAVIVAGEAARDILESCRDIYPADIIGRVLEEDGGDLPRVRLV